MHLSHLGPHMLSPSQPENRWCGNSQHGFIHTSALASWQEDSARSWGGPSLSFSVQSQDLSLCPWPIHVVSLAEYREFLHGSPGFPKAETGSYLEDLGQKLAQHHVCPILLVRVSHRASQYSMWERTVQGCGYWEAWFTEVCLWRLATKATTFLFPCFLRIYLV